MTEDPRVVHVLPRRYRYIFREVRTRATDRVRWYYLWECRRCGTQLKPNTAGAQSHIARHLRAVAERVTLPPDQSKMTAKYLGEETMVLSARIPVEYERAAAKRRAYVAGWDAGLLAAVGQRPDKRYARPMVEAAYDRGFYDAQGIRTRTARRPAGDLTAT